MALALVGTDDNNAQQATFDDFWTLYPRREARKDALRAWERMNESDRMLAVVAICDWRRVWAAQGRDTRTTPMPATWLNGERWTDELPTTAQVSPSASHQPAKLPTTERSVMPQSVRDAIAKLRSR